MSKLTSPLYFHFGSYSWFNTSVNIFNDFVDINAIYFFYFLLINFAIFYKNTFLQTFVKNLFKLPLSQSLNILLLFILDFIFSKTQKINFFFKTLYVYYSKLLK